MQRAIWVTASWVVLFVAGYVLLRPAPTTDWGVALAVDGNRKVFRTTERDCRTLADRLYFGQSVTLIIDGVETVGEFMQCMEVNTDGRVKRTVKAADRPI